MTRQIRTAGWQLALGLFLIALGAHVALAQDAKARVAIVNFENNSTCTGGATTWVRPPPTS